MAIGFNLGSPMGRLTAADLGVPDYVGALSRGISLGFQPSKQAQELLGSMLANKIRGAKAAYAMDREGADLAHTQAATGLIGQQAAGLGIENEYLPEKLQLANKLYKFRADNPLLELPGAAGQIGALKYLDQEDPFYGSLLKESLSQQRARPSLGSYGKALNDVSYAEQQYGEQSEAAKGARTRLANLVNQGKPGFGKATSSTLTTNQLKVNNIPTIIQGIENLISHPSPTEIPYLPFIKSGQKATHHALVNENADTLVKAMGWPNTNESLSRAKEILDRHSFETDNHYRQRLKEFGSRLAQEYNEAKNVLSEGVPLQKQQEVNAKKFDINNYEAPPGSVGMYKGNDLFFIPEDKVEAALQQGYTYE